MTITTPKKDNLRVGIINPNWTPMRYNTDHRCVMDFATMNSHAEKLKLSFAGTPGQYFMANANLVSRRLAGRPLFPCIQIEASPSEFDVLYRYGSRVNGLQVRKSANPPVMATVGYPSLRQVIAKGDKFMNDYADQLEAETNNDEVLHFHTDCMRELFLERKPQHTKRCVTIPFFLPHLMLISEEQTREKYRQDGTLLLFVGADGKRKGLDELCAALDVVADELHSRKVQVVIVSKHAPSCTRFKSIRYEKSLPREAVQSLMRQAHIYCMVPRFESFGLVFVEAMAAGCAVISDDDIPRQEILDKGRCGLLLPARQIEPLASNLLSLVADRSRMEALGLAGLARARACYEPTNTADAYARAFHSMAA